MNRPKKAHPNFRLHDSHRRVLEYVRQHPGCCKYDAAEAGTRHPLRAASKQYYLVNTLIRNGYIKAVRKTNRYELKVPRGIFNVALEDTKSAGIQPEAVTASCNNEASISPLKIWEGSAT